MSLLNDKRRTSGFGFVTLPCNHQRDKSSGACEYKLQVVCWYKGQEATVSLQVIPAIHILPGFVQMRVRLGHGCVTELFSLRGVRTGLESGVLSLALLFVRKG